MFSETFLDFFFSPFILTIQKFQIKYSPNDGGLMSKHFDVAVLCSEARALCKSPLTKYIFPTALNPIFFFFKSINLK